MVWYTQSMEIITRNVRDIESDERRVLEHVIGQQLKENQKIIIQVVSLVNHAAETPQHSATQPGALPEWCNVFDGLNDKEVAEVEEVIRQRSNLTRPSA